MAVADATRIFYVRPFGGGGWRVLADGVYGPRVATKEQAVQQASDAATARRTKGNWVEVQVLGDDDRYHPVGIGPFGWRR